MDKSDGERGQPASFDPKSGEVHGAGSGAGSGGNSEEDFDSDPMAGAAHFPQERPGDEEPGR